MPGVIEMMSVPEVCNHQCTLSQNNPCRSIEFGKRGHRSMDLLVDLAAGQGTEIPADQVAVGLHSKVYLHISGLFENAAESTSTKKSGAVVGWVVGGGESPSEPLSAD